MRGPESASASPAGPRSQGDSGDVWVHAPTGERYWGRYGAAGLLLHSADRGVLLQHRALWSHHGGTWGIPGGALHAGEEPERGALREANEEAGVPAALVTTFATSVVDRDVWRYTTVLARTTRAFEPEARDAESLELRWVREGDVDALPLHPAFAQAWPHLRSMMAVSPTVIVDVANVVGSRPDGWWRDRRGAAMRLIAGLDSLSRRGVPASALQLPGDTWHPRMIAIVEGQARGVPGTDRVDVVDSPGVGDDAVVDSVHECATAGYSVTVVTSDRALQGRVRDAGGRAVGSSWATDLLAPG